MHKPMNTMQARVKFHRLQNQWRKANGHTRVYGFYGIIPMIKGRHLTARMLGESVLPHYARGLD